ncbi:MAG: ABC transporter ATP-binding protein [Bryobacterales bacterium]|nr:ABC transporter ATP-binding protein [Bryobacterales bacterium]
MSETAMNGLTPLLSVSLNASYPNRPHVLEDVRFDVQQGEILALVGQSGCGKSTIALCILKLLGVKGGSASGAIKFQGRDLEWASEREMRAIRGRQIAMVPQSPLSSLNPALRIGAQLKEAWRAHAEEEWEAAKPRVLQLLESVDLPCDEGFLRRVPSQISVGQAQRVLIAMAVIHRPRLLIADEPTSALDLITQREVLDLFARLNRELNMAILYISHDLLSVAALCHRAAVLERGRIVECGTAEQIFERPAHPYTRRLIDALPRVGQPSGVGQSF